MANKSDLIYNRVELRKKYLDKVIQLRTGAEMVVRDNMSIPRDRFEKFLEALNDCNDAELFEIAEAIGKLNKVGVGAGHLETTYQALKSKMELKTREFLYGKYRAENLDN